MKNDLFFGGDFKLIQKLAKIEVSKLSDKVPEKVVCV